MQVVQRLYSNLQKRLKERREEKNWKGYLSIKIMESDAFPVISAMLDDIKVVKVEETTITYKLKYLLPVGSDWEKPQCINVSVFPENVQKEIKQFLREKKLKRLNKL